MRTRISPSAVVLWPKIERDLDATQQTTGGIHEPVSTRFPDCESSGSYSNFEQRTVFYEVSIKSLQLRRVPENRDTEQRQVTRWNRACQALTQLDIPMRRVDKPCIGDLARGGRRRGQRRGLGDDSTPVIIRTWPGQPETVLLASLIESRADRTGFFRSGTVAADCTTWPIQMGFLLSFWVLHLPWHVAQPVGAPLLCLPRMVILTSHACMWTAEVYSVAESELRMDSKPSRK